ncbi:hypothetical protein DBV15_10928 [Temnothorax longispinosus]|uniref:Uncharacterized protein n=1 Tax=Temnothorax longispinosus TaxID=300112 RepID=A0A4S2KQ34_9HYME|nr:hypothetical protein DBV15_10928 [Temnothorax longispinosus]
MVTLSFPVIFGGFVNSSTTIATKFLFSHEIEHVLTQAFGVAFPADVHKSAEFLQNTIVMDSPEL